MKNVLDHRILIPKSPETVWRYLSDLNNNANWQADCGSVSFLTSRHTGVGVRWRCQASGHDCVIETTAWYDGLGYEYTYVDGMPFDANRGRIRLQEIPEGTVVQWTLSYDTKGFLSGVRNSISLRRQVEGMMVESLRMLWRKLNQAGDDNVHRESKSLMRDAPGYEERVRYKPRYPSARLENAEAAEESVPAVPVIDEPPIADDDTRPSRAAEPARETEPDFLQKFTEPEIVEDSVPPVQITGAASEPETRKPVAVPDETPAEKPANEVTPPVTIGTWSVESEPVLPADVPEAPESAPEETFRPAPPPEAAAPTTQTRREPLSPEELAKMDTREISVFEIFGLPKPSETQELRAALTEDATPPQAALPTITGGRIGLRLAQRRSRLKLRRPG